MQEALPRGGLTHEDGPHVVDADQCRASPLLGTPPHLKRPWLRSLRGNDATGAAPPIATRRDHQQDRSRGPFRKPLIGPQPRLLPTDRTTRHRHRVARYRGKTRSTPRLDVRPGGAAQGRSEPPRSRRSRQARASDASEPLGVRLTRSWRYPARRVASRCVARGVRLSAVSVATEAAE